MQTAYVREHFDRLFLSLLAPTLDSNQPGLVVQIQEWYLVEQENVKRARVFLKHLVSEGSRHAAFILTGSSLSTFWMNLVNTPTNGFAVLQDGCRIDLPADAPSSPVMDAVWS